uniref:Uncharacterized protein n=1 Tax=Nothobranchius furzeri TaxID=105023 RepID=A0A1A8UMJ7_NOTFU
MVPEVVRMCELFPHHPSSSFCAEPEWNHYRNRKENEKKTDRPVGNTSVTSSSDRHWTSACHFPAERRGGRRRREEEKEKERGKEGGLRFKSNQILKNKKAPFEPFFSLFFNCAEVKSSALL